MQNMPAASHLSLENSKCFNLTIVQSWGLPMHLHCTHICITRLIITFNNEIQHMCIYIYIYMFSNTWSIYIYTLHVNSSSQYQDTSLQVYMLDTNTNIVDPVSRNETLIHLHAFTSSCGSLDAFIYWILQQLRDTTMCWVHVHAETAS